MDENTNKRNVINKLESIFTIKPTTLDGIIIVSRQQLLSFLNELSESELSHALLAMLKFHEVPQFETHEFRNWVILKREIKKISQSELARLIGARPEQISRFESNTFPLKKEFLKKIREVLS